MCSKQANYGVALNFRPITNSQGKLIGYGMARNLRLKMPAASTLIISDVKLDVMNQFIADIAHARKARGEQSGGMKVEVARSVREVAEKSVS